MQYFVDGKAKHENLVSKEFVRIKLALRVNYKADILRVNLSLRFIVKIEYFTFLHEIPLSYFHLVNRTYMKVP